MRFSDDDILVLQELDLDLADLTVPSRARDLAWWAALVVGVVAAALVLLGAGIPLLPVAPA